MPVVFLRPQDWDLLYQSAGDVEVGATLSHPRGGT
ncbi:MAG: hypothetical protein JWM57_2988, partial [Phycisphaerales bacterium]|nr:hypothetical protein [Phycisphaerales bacterium]